MRRALFVLTELFVSALLIFGMYLGYTHRNELLDWYYLRDYQPPAQIAALADQAKFTEEGRRLFYRARPQIDPDRQALARDCHIADEKTIELGCYLSNDKIYLLDIQQPELASEMVVTAAHETLHAAYERMSSGDKKRLDAELQRYANQVTDDRLAERLADYRQLEPGEESNELHSIIGTEFEGLPPALEKHYARYLSDRAKIVAYNNQFNRTFDGLHDEITRLDDRIKATKSQMNLYLQRGQITTYNSLVPSVNQDISTYNSKVELYNRYSSVLLGTQTTQAAQ